MANIDCLRSTLRDRWTVVVLLSHSRSYQTQHTPQRLNFEPVLPGGNRLFLPMRGTFLLSNGAPAALRQCAWKLRNYLVNSQSPSQPVLRSSTRRKLPTLCTVPFTTVGGCAPAESFVLRNSLHRESSHWDQLYFSMMEVGICGSPKVPWNRSCDPH